MVMTRRPDAPAREHRAYAIQRLEVRAARDDGGAIPMEGYAAMFNSRSHVLWDWWEGSFVEEIVPGAFTKTLSDNADVRLLINHDPNLILARTRAGTLKLGEDEVGLRVDAEMGPTTYAQDLAISMRRGDISQMSFAFRVIKDDWKETEDGLPLRYIHEASLLDTSVVTYPAYEETLASARSRQFGSAEEVEQFLATLISREINSVSPEALRAARTALDARLDAIEPHAQHSMVDAEAILLRHRFNTRKAI